MTVTVLVIYSTVAHHLCDKYSNRGAMLLKCPNTQLNSVSIFITLPMHYKYIIYTLQGHYIYFKTQIQIIDDYLLLKRVDTCMVVFVLLRMLTRYTGNR